MTWLGGGMYDCIRFDLPDAVQDFRPVPDVNFVVTKTGELVLEAFLVPGGVSLGPKKISPHIVVETAHLPGLTTKKCYNFAADEAVRASNQ